MKIYLTQENHHRIQNYTFIMSEATFYDSPSFFRLLLRLLSTSTLGTLHSCYLIPALPHVRRVLSLVGEPSPVAHRTYDRLSFPVHGSHVEAHVLLRRVRLPTVFARQAIGWVDVVNERLQRAQTAFTPNRKPQNGQLPERLCGAKDYFIY